MGWFTDKDKKVQDQQKEKKGVEIEPSKDPRTTREKQEDLIKQHVEKAKEKLDKGKEK